jgi:hypothetical protein
MHAARARLLALNVVGGVAVLGSYWYGFSTARDPSALWGGVPEWLRPAYTVSMLAAAAGYFPPLAFVLVGLDPDRMRIGRRGHATILACYAAILVPSALWMPLTFRMIEVPSAGLWLAIRVVLFAVAAGSLGLLAAIVRATPRPAGAGWVLALAGQVVFCVQTVALDALVWPAYFR